jgi:DNA-binding NarL/FixJ family response regulator
MAAATGASEFLNRNSEREHLDTLLADVGEGHSAALVLRGEAGVGKTALPRYAARRAFGFRVAQIAGNARKRIVETRDELTTQERQIAQLARDGLSNPEIGTRLFLSPRTVEWHLRKVFTKLEIRSRHELSSALPSSESGLTPA